MGSLCTTGPAMSGNGSKIAGTMITMERRRTGRSRLLEIAVLASCAAVRGATLQGSSASPSASGCLNGAGFRVCQNAYPLNLYLFTPRVQGRSSWRNFFCHSKPQRGRVGKIAPARRSVLRNPFRRFCPRGPARRPTLLTIPAGVMPLRNCTLSSVLPAAITPSRLMTGNNPKYAKGPRVKLSFEFVISRSQRPPCRSQRYMVSSVKVRKADGNSHYQ